LFFQNSKHTCPQASKTCLRVGSGGSATLCACPTLRAADGRGCRLRPSGFCPKRRVRRLVLSPTTSPPSAANACRWVAVFENKVS
jgi:hypothetical protein